MSSDMDQEILQDFLVEAGEILELLQEQLVQLEQSPGDSELLNAIFRGFHTVKGGAGFLSLTAMVDACHVTENLFDALRNGTITLNEEMMDEVLIVSDSLNVMFSQLQEGQPLSGAPQETINKLNQFCQPQTAEAAPEVQADSEQSVSPSPEPNLSDERCSEMIEQLKEVQPTEGQNTLSQEQLDSALTEREAPTDEAKDDSVNADEISEDEFESLLDEIHGAGSFTVDKVASDTSSVEAAPSAEANDDLISDEEFEKVLDEIHGSGQFNIDNTAKSSSAQDSCEAVSQGAEVSVSSEAPVVPTPDVSAPEATGAPSIATKPEPQEQPIVTTAIKQADATVRVDTGLLDNIMNMVGELVLVRNRLVSIGVNHKDEELTQPLANLDLVTADLQGAVMKTRMQPIKKVFGRFPRVVRDLARSLHKEIKLELVGEETDLDKNLVEALSDPLVHLVRNSVDHGIEMPDVREQMGKEREGVIRLSASQEGDHILLTIEDDGAGMDAQLLKNLAIERGVIDSETADRMKDEDAFNLIFAPGFSTKQEISDISGRGVGMDVVKTKITQLNGSVAIHSVKSEGTKLQIKVPLTLAIMPTLMVSVDKQTFALPLACVNEIINLDDHTTNKVDNQLTIVVREESVPLFYLSDLLKGMTTVQIDEGNKACHVVILRFGNQTIGMLVDTLIGQEEVVIKPLGKLLQGTSGMAGATITSDGGIALILDLASLIQRFSEA